MTEKIPRTLVFLKPDCTLRRAVSAKVIKAFIENNFKITAFKELYVDKNLAEKHYEEHKDKHFYPWLLKMVQLAPVVAMIIEDTPEHIRNFIGNTFCHKADDTTLRGKFGIWGGVNSIHASDSITSAEREIQLWENFAKLTSDPKNTSKEIYNYITKWDRDIKTNIKEIRNICDMIKNSPAKRNEAKELLRKSLFNDLMIAEKNILEQFLDIIIENCCL